MTPNLVTACPATGQVRGEDRQGDCVPQARRHSAFPFTAKGVHRRWTAEMATRRAILGLGGARRTTRCRPYFGGARHASGSLVAATSRLISGVDTRVPPDSSLTYEAGALSV